MKKFSQYLDEMKLKPRRLADDERRWARTFQSAMKRVLDFQETLLNDRNADPRAEFARFKEDMRAYSQEPWAGRAANWIANKEEELLQQDKAKEAVDDAKKDWAAIYKVGMAAMKQGPKAFASFGQKYGQLPYQTSIAKAGDDHAFKRGRNVAKWVINPFYKENPLFFGNRGFVTQFQESDFEQVINTDLDTALTVFPYPAESENYEHVAYWFMKLRVSDEEWEVPSGELKRAVKMQNLEDGDLDEMLEFFDDYLKRNDGGALRKGMALLPNYPAFFERNEEAKRKISVVYRGVADHFDADDYDPDEPDAPTRHDYESVKAEDRRRGYVAATRYKTVAERFVYTGGAHLIVKSESDSGWLLAYGVGPESIVLDTSIFGGIFGEAEIVIDATKAVVEDIEYLYGEEHDDARRGSRDDEDDY